MTNALLPIPPKKRGRPKKLDDKKLDELISLEAKDFSSEDILEKKGEEHIDTRSLQERAFSQAEKISLHPSRLPFRVIYSYLESNSLQMKEFSTSIRGMSFSEIPSALYRFLVSKGQVRFWGDPSHGDLVFCSDNGKISQCYLVDQFVHHEKKLYVLDNEMPTIIECKTWNAFGKVLE